MRPLPVLLVTDEQGTHWHVYAHGLLAGHGSSWTAESHDVGCRCMADRRTWPTLRSWLTRLRRFRG